MQNDHIDFQNLKITKLINPLFHHCSKAIPLPSLHDSPSNSNLPILQPKNPLTYILLPDPVQIQEKIFQCKSLCPIFNSNQHSFILVKGHNLWDFYRTKKEHEVILTEEELWILIKQISQALIKLQEFNLYHSHLKQYAIYRQSPHSYQLVYHPQIRPMRNLSRSNDSFYWYDFYLSPEELKSDQTNSFNTPIKETVFSLGLLLLNVMNPDDFNRSVYSKKNFEVDWDIVKSKIVNSEHKYSTKLINLVKNCLKQSPDQRYGFKQVLNDTIAAISLNKSLNLQFKSKFDQVLSSKFNFVTKKPLSNYDSALRKYEKSNSKSQSPKSSNSPQSPSNSPQSPSKFLQSPQKDSKQKCKKSPEGQKKFVKTLESPPKKWKSIQKSQNKLNTLAKPYEIAKQKPNLLKETSNQKLTKKQSPQKKQITKKNFQTHDDVINFQRGTFGGDQSSQMSSFSSSKFKKDIRIEIQSDPSESIKDQAEIKQVVFGQEGNFQTDKLISFGEMKSEEVLKPSNSVGSLNSEIYILDSARKKQRQSIVESQSDKKAEEALIEQFERSLSMKNPESLRTKSYTLENIRECANALEREARIHMIASTIEIQAQKITLNLKDCLQPLQILKNLVSQTHGVYIQGNLYFGPFKHGRRNGFGLQIYAQNEYYLGNFRDDLFDGQGFYFWNKNDYFLGLFENGRKVFGNLYGPKLHYVGQFSNSRRMNGFGKAKFKNGQEYIGEWVEGRRSGFGKLTEFTKDIFIGFWEKGKRAGYGEYISSDFPQEGYHMKAFWKDSDIISDVIIQYPNQNLYEGSLNQNQKHGKGHFIFKNGGYFKGTFYQDNATHGELVYKNGQKYIGSLKNMKRHGFGEYHYLDGTVKKGNWIQDVRIQKEINIKEIN